jgi:hypothetical protein
VHIADSLEYVSQLSASAWVLGPAVELILNDSHTFIGIQHSQEIWAISLVVQPNSIQRCIENNGSQLSLAQLL